MYFFILFFNDSEEEEGRGEVEEYLSQFLGKRRTAWRKKNAEKNDGEKDWKGEMEED